MYLSGCTSLKQFSNQKKIQSEIKSSDVFSKHFAGLAIYDPETDEYLVEQNADKHFIPASTTKLLTFYAAISTIGDTLIGLRYEHSGDSILIQGTGDPTFLHPKFDKQPVLEFLQNVPDSLMIVLTNGEVNRRYGSGWAWDDYQYNFQVELSSFPVHGNYVSISVSDTGLFVQPSVFKDLVEINGIHHRRRSELYNYFVVSGEKGTKNLPYKTSNRLVAQMLQEELGRKIQYWDTTLNLTNTVSSLNAPFVYHRMLQASDNFLAEQLLLMSSNYAGFRWDTDKFIQSIKLNDFKSFSNLPVWRDGSGLSRYNLVTPRSMTELLVLIKNETGIEKAKSYLPTGGVSGTIKNWYKADQPYVFAKTGTLSNVHCLSGYIETKSGKTLVFSFMNNNYTNGSSIVKKEMQRVLEMISDRF
jgi:D-alanyl-D-alanine carboxypeptidase/D-alanyl-D-alanine-endopeptidase (penicillin-binding protein 4)